MEALISLKNFDFDLSNPKPNFLAADYDLDLESCRMCRYRELLANRFAGQDQDCGSDYGMGVRFV